MVQLHCGDGYLRLNFPPTNWCELSFTQNGGTVSLGHDTAPIIIAKLFRALSAPGNLRKSFEIGGIPVTHILMLSDPHTSFYLSHTTPRVLYLQDRDAHIIHQLRLSSSDVENWRCILDAASRDVI